jgi:uncharacterized protein
MGARPPGESAMTTVIGWFEIPSTEFDRAVEFYETVFEYEITETTVNDTPYGIVSTDGEEVGAITRLDEYTFPNGTTISYEPGSEGGVRLYFDVPDGLTEALSRVESAGGTVLVGKQRVSTGTHFAFVEDSEGNEIGLWEGR